MLLLNKMENGQIFFKKVNFTLFKVKKKCHLSPDVLFINSTYVIWYNSKMILFFNYAFFFV